MINVDKTELKNLIHFKFRFQNILFYAAALAIFFIYTKN